MASDDIRRRLLWHGVLLVLLALLTGLLVPVVTSPRLALSAHVGGIMNGMLLILAGLLWQELRLAPRQQATACRLLLFGMYAIWAFILLAAAFGASYANPIAGAGHSAPAWQEALTTIGIVSGALAVLGAIGLILYGLRAGGAAQR